jgi:hypothetical protein
MLRCGAAGRSPAITGHVALFVGEHRDIGGRLRAAHRKIQHEAWFAHAAAGGDGMRPQWACVLSVAYCPTIRP